MIASDCRRPLSASVRIQLVHGRQPHACERTAQTTTQTAARPNHTANRFRRRSSPTPYTEQRSYQRISRSNHDGTSPRKHNHPAAKPYRLWHATAARHNRQRNRQRGKSLLHHSSVRSRERHQTPHHHRRYRRIDVNSTENHQRPSSVNGTIRPARLIPKNETGCDARNKPRATPS